MGGPNFQGLNRNKRGLTVDISKPEGCALIRRLVGRADVLVENFRPGVMDRHDLGWTHLEYRVNPRLVYCSITAFGPRGPLAQEPAMDLVLHVDSLQRRKLRPVVVLLMVQSFGSRTNNEELAGQLMERSVPVCEVYCDAHLPETLSKFSENTYCKGCLMAAARVVPLDLKFQGRSQAIASYLIRYPDGAVLVESGPGSTLAGLQTGLASEGLAPRDVTHVLLTHIHLDHAGAAGWLARRGAQIYVHPVGAPQLLDPERLLTSASHGRAPHRSCRPHPHRDAVVPTHRSGRGLSGS